VFDRGVLKLIRCYGRSFTFYVAQFPLAPFNGEKSLRTNEADLTELAAFKIAVS
jgi:hypothetical protein